MLRSAIKTVRAARPVLARPQTVLRSQLRVSNRAFLAKKVEPSPTLLTRSLMHAAKSTSQDGMARFPALTSPGGLLRGLDYFGTVVFAISGTVTAGAAGMDILGCVQLGRGMVKCGASCTWK